MLDVVRANTFVAEVLGLDTREVSVLVLGGHAGVTILPLLSQVKPPCSFTKEETKYLTKSIQDGGTEVVLVGAQTSLMQMTSAGGGFAWQSYNDQTKSYDDNSYTTVGLLEQLNVTRDSSDYLWYMTDVRVGSNEGFLKSGKWPTLLVQSAGHAFEYFCSYVLDNNHAQYL